MKKYLRVGRERERERKILGLILSGTRNVKSL